MSNEALPTLPMLAFSGALMFLLPHFTPRRYFFTITVPPDFHASEPARAIVRRYHLQLLAVIALSIVAVLLIAPGEPGRAMVLATALPLLAGMACLLRARNEVRQYAAAQSPVRAADISTAPEQLPRWVALALPPFAAPLAMTVYLRANWQRIPERFPIHWDLNGHPNGWAQKSNGAPFTSLIVAAGLMLFVLLLSLVVFYGSRRGPQRAAVLKIEIAVLYLIAYAFTIVALMPLVHIPMAALLAPNVVFTVGVIAWCIKLTRDARMPVDNTPDDHWRLGSIYYNPGDPAIFVQKRLGFGYTINFGNHMSWLIMGLFTAGMIGLVLASR